jgi:hypothetical protein
VDENTLNGDFGASLMGGAVSGIIGFVLGIAVIIGLWKLFTKAGKPGFYAIIPLLNFKTLVDITGLPTAWFWYFLIGAALSPITFGFTGLICLYVAYIVMRQLLRSFGKSDSIGSVILHLVLAEIMLPLIGFSAQPYLGVQSIADVRTLPFIK